MQTFQTVYKKIQSNWIETNPNEPSFILNKPVLDSTNLTAGVGIDIDGIYPDFTISALNTDPLWNANQLQGVPISNTIPTNGQVLLFNGTTWIPFTIDTGATGSVTSVDGDLTNGNSLDVTSTPITTSGTILLTWQGTASQIVLGNGVLADYPIEVDPVFTANGVYRNYRSTGSIGYSAIADLNSTANAFTTLISGGGSGAPPIMPNGANVGVLWNSNNNLIDAGYGSQMVFESTTTGGTSEGFVWRTKRNGTWFPWLTVGSREWVLSQGYTTNTGTVTSVNATATGALSVTGGPITTSGVLNFLWTGTSGEYVRGNGTLGTFPTIPTVNNGTLTMNTTGIATGSSVFTANQASGSTFTVNVPGTNISTNTVSNVVTINSSTGTGGSFNLPNLIAGNNVAITGTYPNLTINSFDTNTIYSAGFGLVLTGTTFSNALPDVIISLTGSGATTVTGTYPNFNISSTDTTYTAGANITIVGNVISAAGPGVINNGTLTLATSGIATGSQTFTANQATNGTFTVNVPGTDLTSSMTGNTLNINSSTGLDTSVLLPIPAQVVLTAGTGISITGTYPSLTITNTLPDQTVSLTGTGSTNITGTYPNFTINSVDTNFATSNLTFTGNRTHNLAGFSCTMSGANNFDISGTGNITLDADTGVNLTANTINGIGLSTTGSTTNQAQLSTILLTTSKVYRFPDTGGVIPITVNGVAADSLGNIILTLPVDTNFANNDLTFPADRTHNLNNHSILYNNSVLYQINATSNIILNNTTGNNRFSVTANGLEFRTNTVNSVRLKTDNVTVLRTLQTPDASGVLVLSVNGITADNAGNIVVPGFTDTNFANTNLTFSANRTHALSGFSATFSGGSAFTIGATAVNLSSVPPTMSGNGYSTLVRDNSTGEIKKIPNPTALPTFTAATNWTSSVLTGSNDDYGTIQVTTTTNLSGSSPGLIGTFTLNTAKGTIMVPNLTLEDAGVSVGTFRSVVVSSRTLSSFTINMAKDTINSGTTFYIHYQIKGY